MKLTSGDIQHVNSLAYIATALMGAATSSGNEAVSVAANSLAGRLIGIASEVVKEDEPVKATSPMSDVEAGPYRGEGTLERYLSACMDKGLIDHRLRCTVDALGYAEFYIHPLNADGETLQLRVTGNVLSPVAQLNAIGSASVEARASGVSDACCIR